MKSDAKQTQQYIKGIIDDGQVKSTARTGWFNIKFNVNMLIFCIHRIKEKHMIISDDSEKVFDKSQYFFFMRKSIKYKKITPDTKVQVWKAHSSQQWTEASLLLRNQTKALAFVPCVAHSTELQPRSWDRHNNWHHTGEEEGSL